MGEKSEAQIRNEEEVHRIMMERGYSSASNNKKQVKKVFGNDFPFGSIISGVIGVAIIIGGWVFLQNYISKDSEKVKTSSYSSSISYSHIEPTEVNEELAKFQACLEAIDASEIVVNDSEFWDKYISRYEQTIACYDNYPSVADLSEKNEIQKILNESRTQDDRYRENMAKIDTDLAKNLADIEAKSKEWDEEFARRQKEAQAQKEIISAESKRLQDEYEARQKAQKEAEEQAKREKESRCLAYIGKTKEELADSDSDVKNAKNAYDRATSNYASVSHSNAAAYSNVVRKAEQQVAANEKISEAKSKMDSAQANYSRVRNSKLSYYSQVLNSCE